MVIRRKLHMSRGRLGASAVALGAGAAVVAVLVTGSSAVAATGTSGGSPSLSALRSHTTAFHNIATAEQNGYGLLTDKDGIACIDMPGMGGMGVHWANSALVGDPAILPNQPEALVYAPGPDGTLTLAAVEYVVIKSAWDATHKFPPKLFGHVFNFTPAGNRFGLPDYYSLHVWVFKHNSAGEFSMWNPAVTCPA
jgi:hypothetical protein